MLTDSQQQLRAVRLFDGLAQATQHDADVLLGTELATTDSTAALQEGMYESDWTTSKKARPGQGVGAFFHSKWRGNGYFYLTLRRPLRADSG